MIKEIARGIWRWTAPHPEWRPAHRWGHQVGCYALEEADALVLLDPQAPLPGSPEAAALWPALDRLVASAARDVHVMITIPYHARSTEAIEERFGRDRVRVWGHGAVAKRLPTTRLREIGPDRELPAGAVALPIGKPRRQEMPLYFPTHKALAFGDSVVGVGRTLRVWDVVEDEGRARWYRDRFLPTLHPLLELDVDHVLVTHGPPAIGDGRQKLRRALALDPWHYRQDVLGEAAEQ
jgi:hypothetical protein